MVIPGFFFQTYARMGPMIPQHSHVILLSAFLLFHALAGAGTTGKVAGKVVDAQTKEPLLGVNVLLVGTTLGASTDIDGEYFVLNIPPGSYSLKASAVGYTPMTVNGVSVTVDQTTRIQFQLQSQSVELSDVVVTAQRPIVQKDLTSTVATVSSDQISALPLEDVSSIVNLQAGVVEGHFRGGRSNEVKYLIDGVAVNDVFSGNFSMEAEVNSVQEIQVLSGTFNAEYGEALSGVVNQVTKIAGETYTGEVSAYTGDYVTSRSGLFDHIDHVSPSNLYNVQGSVSGPVPGTDGLVKFFLSGRHFYDDGYLYGKRVFNPSDSSNTDPNNWNLVATGDGKYVPMNFQKRWSVQGKLSLKVGPGKGIVLSGMYQQHNYRDYDHQFRFNPDGDYLRFQKGFMGSAGYTHVFSDAAFLDLTGSYFRTKYQQYVYENPLDPRYRNPDMLRNAGANTFLIGGTQNWHFTHTTETSTGRADLTAQVSTVHQIKTGAEVQVHALRYEDFQIHVDAESGYKPALPAEGSFDFNVYQNHPYQLAAYIQDKIELEYLVVNIGLRYDYFQPDGRVLANADSIAKLDPPFLPPFPDGTFKKAGVKSQFSPRVGISYPITDRGAVHFSYGHFFQVPPFEFLYKNPNFRIPLTGNLPEFVGNVIGNADLEPQRTTMYEVGLQQELAPNLGLTLTGYYKDIRNLLGIEIHIKNDFKKFGKYVNRDYGSVRGATIALEKRLADGFGGTVDYTYQIARGNASDPNDDFNKAQSNPPIESNKQLVPLSWDRRHSLNVTLTVGDPADIVGSMIARLGSGLPYTPSLQNQRTGLENSDNRPTFFTTDLYVTKCFKLISTTVSVFIKVYNVFDTSSEIDVFGDTGRAGYTLELTRAQQAPRGVNSLEQYFTRPDFFSAPRQVVVGASLSF
jgi:outer membrane receptor protein involved in Fe transport